MLTIPKSSSYQIEHNLKGSALCWRSSQRKGAPVVSKYSECGAEVERLLRLRTVTVGIKLFEKAKDIPGDFHVMDHHCSVCQVIGMARYHEKAVAATTEWAFACAAGAAFLGFRKVPEDIADGTRNLGVWGEPREAVRKLFQNRMMIEKGRFQKEEIRLGIADIGDRRYGYAADEEMIAGIPAKAFERLAQNLRKSYSGCYKYSYDYYFFPMSPSALERNRA